MRMKFVASPEHGNFLHLKEENSIFTHKSGLSSLSYHQTSLIMNHQASKGLRDDVHGRPCPKAPLYAVLIVYIQKSEDRSNRRSTALTIECHVHLGIHLRPTFFPRS